MKHRSYHLEYIQRSPWSSKRGDIIHLFTGGSELHGAKVEGTDDHDIYGVFVDHATGPLGIDYQDHTLQHFVWSTAGQGHRNTKDDVDITLYSLQKWAYLACKGNVTILHFLFTPNAYEKETHTRTVWRKIIRYRNLFMAKSQLKGLFGFADNQYHRVIGQKGSGKKRQRPELIELHGYDTKAAMHALRILYETQEIIGTGKLTLPNPNKEILIAIRRGEWQLEEFMQAYEKMKIDCVKAQTGSPLPDTIDRSAVSKLISKCYLEHWRK